MAASFRFSADRSDDIANIFSQISALLEGRYAVLLQHKRMLTKIQLKKISDEEFKEYLKDEIGISRDLSDDEKQTVLADMEKSMTDALKLVMELKLLCSEPINSISVLQFYYTLTFALHNTGFAFKRKNSANESWDYRGSFAFNQHLLIKDCIKKLDPCLPPTRKVLDQIIAVSDLVNADSNRRKTSVEYTFQTYILIQTDKLQSLYKTDKHFISKNIYELTPKLIHNVHQKIVLFLSENQISDEHQYAVLSLLEKKTNLLIELCRVAGATDLSQTEWDHQIRFSYYSSRLPIQLIEVFEQMKEVCEFIVIPTEEKKQAEKAFKEKSALFKTKFTNINTRIDFVLQQIKLAKKANYSVEDIKRIEELRASIISAHQEVTRYKSQWQTKFIPAGLSSRESVNELEKLTLQSISRLSKLSKKSLDEIDAMATQPIVVNPVPVLTEISAQVKADYQAFREQQAKAIQAYKAQVEAKRAEKRAAKLLALKASETPQETPIELVKNTEMAFLLSQLKKQQLELLKSILEVKVGEVKYPDVVNLIKEHLGGSISEIGSSHKRIKIGKYYTEIHDDGDVATGGIVRPHGKSHNNGKMSRFNIELVKLTLEKARITLEVVCELEQKLTLTTTLPGPG